jgi:hypothetical protein
MLIILDARCICRFEFIVFLCIWCGLGIFVLNCSSPVQCMTYDMYYTYFHRFHSCPILAYFCLFLALWAVVGWWCSWRIFPHLCVWISWWFFLLLGCSIWRLSMFCFCFFHWVVSGWFFFCVVFDGLVFVEGFVRSYYFVHLVVLMSILFCFLFGVNVRECILVMWYLKQQFCIPCVGLKRSGGWFAEYVNFKVRRLSDYK